MSEEYLGAGVGLDTTAFKTGVTELRAQIKQIENSFRASAAVMGGWSKSTEGLTSRTASLEEKLKLQKQALSTLNSEYKKTVSEQGAGSKSAQSLANQMYSMEKQINSTEKDLEKYNRQLQLQSSGFERLHLKMKDVSEQAKAVGKGLSDVGKTMVSAVTVPIAAAGVALSKMSMDFEKSSSKVSTIADTAAVSMDTLKKGVLQVSNETGESADNLNEALYQTISAGVKTADSVKFLGTATKLAKGGFTDSSTAIDALTTTINAYGLKASDAKTISDQLIQTQNLGKTTVADLGGALGNVIPIAASLNVKTTDLFGSIAELTKNGVKTDEAVTGMKGAFSSILSPTKEASEAAKQLGIDFSAAHLKNVGWPKFLEEVKEKTGGNSEKMSKLFGNVRALNAVTILAGKGNKDFTDILGKMGKTAGSTDSAFAKMEDNGAAKWEKSVNKMKNAGIRLGESLAPAVEKISDATSKLSEKFSSLSPAQQEMILKIAGIVAAVGPVILIIGKLVTGIGAIAGFIGTVSGAIAVVTTGAAAAIPAIAGLAGAIKLVGAAFKFMTGPVGIAILIISALVATFIYLWNNCEGFRNFWIGLWNGIKAAAKAVGDWFSGSFVNFFKGAWSGIQGAFSNVGSWFASTFQNAKNGVQSAWSNAGDWFSSAGEKIKSGFNATINWIKDNWKSLVLFIVNPIAGAVSLLYNNNPAFRKWADNAMKTVKEGFTNGWNAVMSFFSTVGNAIVNFFDPFLNKLKNAFLAIWEPIRDGLSQAWNGIKTAAAAAWEIIKNVVLAPVLLLIDLVTGNFGQMKSDLDHIWLNIQNAAATFWTGLQMFFTGIGNAIVGAAKAYWNIVANGFTNLWNNITTGAVNAWNRIIQFFAQTWKTIKTSTANAWKGFWTVIFTALGNIKNGIVNTWNSVISWFRALPGTLWRIGSNMFTSMRNGVRNTVHTVADAAKSGIGAAVNWLKSLPGTLWNIGSNMFTSMRNGVTGTVHKVSDAVKSGIGAAVKWIKDLPSEALKWGEDIIDGIVNGIKRAASAVRDAVDGVAQNIRSFLHFSVPDEGPLTDYESWMPDFMTGLARGIEKSKYKVRNAIQALSTDISVGVNPRPGAPVPAFAGAGGNSTVNNYSISQTIQGAKDTSAAENYRQLRDLARQLNLKRG